MERDPKERARKGYSLVLRELADPGRQSGIAAAMGVSESTVSRIKSERLEEAITLLSYLGLKVVPADFRCVSAATYQFLTETHQRIMAEAPQLVWGDTET